MLIWRILLAAGVLLGSAALPACNSVYHKGTNELEPMPARFVTRVREAGVAARGVQDAMGVAGRDVSGAAWEFERRVLAAKDVYQRLDAPPARATEVMRVLEAAAAAANRGAGDVRARVADAVRAADEFARAER